MKKVKRILSILLAVMAAAMLAVPAFAVEGSDEAEAASNTLNITVQGGVSGSEYVAYKLLDLGISTGSTAGGTATTNYAYIMNSKYRAILQAATNGKADSNQDGDIVLYFEGLQSNSTALRALADDVYKRIKTASLTADYTVTADTNGNAVFEGVDQGYYLIAESQVGNESDSYSLVMLETAGLQSVTVTTKEGVPTLTKKVKADNTNNATSTASGDWTDAQDAADYDIGDSVPFQLVGTLPQNIKNYSSYTYTFHDTLSAGLTYNNDVHFYYVQTINGATTWTDLTDYKYTSDEDKQEHYAFTTTTSTNDGGTELTFNLNAIKGLVTHSEEGDQIVVRYTATLNENAVIGSTGNSNVAYLEYSNNPYNSSSTGKSETDKVKVFTYQAIVNKTTSDGTPLAGAGFTLYKAGTGDTWTTVGTGTANTAGTTFTFTGLDAGTYKLVETTVPTGYHAADDLVFKVQATYDISTADPALTALVALDSSNNPISGSTATTEVFTVDLSKGSLTTNVINETGTLLPSTGGIGTKIFTVGGIALMVVAGVLLVTRRRMAK
jgi:fimbrial isopeptide formation D2 family protein/LPXTG-motif cell wall-anchored protein